PFFEDPIITRWSGLFYYAQAMASQDPSYTEAVVPQNKDLGTVRKSFVFTMPENSVGVLKLTPVESR
ncbi:MAG: hypothetical protein ACI3ZH_04490, partial [Candidatus Cryptobacteroides sp.]